MKRRLIGATMGAFAAICAALTVGLILSTQPENIGFLPDESPSVIEESSFLPVLYYGEQRIGAVGGDFDEEELISAMAGTLGDYAAGQEVCLRMEETEEVPMSFKSCLRAVVSAVHNEYTLADGLYIDGTLVAATEDENTAQTAVQEFLSAFEELKGEKGKAELKDASFESCIVRKDELLSSEEIKAVLAVCCAEEMSFGEDVEKVSKFLENHHMPSISPVFVEQMTKSYEETVPFETVELTDEALYKGQRVLQTPGKTGMKKVTVLLTFENGEEVSRRVISEETLTAATNEVVRVGILAPGTATGSFIWTTDEGYISSLYGYRDLFGETRLHAGIDIAVPVGTKLYAGDGGTVIHAGDAGNGYGIYVIIDHGNGITTYYAHMSQVAVKVGDKLQKGDLVGYSGATGRVTGPHVHYEFRINGQSVNPKKYLSER